MSVNIHTSYAPTYSANNPVIGWNSATKRGTVTASTSADGYAAANAADASTTTFWRPTALTATWKITTPTAETFSYCGIASHSLGGTGCTVTVQLWSGASWVDRGSVTPTDDSVIMFLFGEYETTQIRIRITGSLAPSIGSVYFGQTLELPQRAYQGFTPIDLATNATFITNVTRGGQLAGRSVQFNGTSNSVNISGIEESWIRSNFVGFMDESLYRPFFFAERPQDYPNALDYMMTTGPIQPQREGGTNHMSFTL